MEKYSLFCRVFDIIAVRTGDRATNRVSGPAWDHLILGTDTTQGLFLVSGLKMKPEKVQGGRK
ncbi:hypothetical protein PK21_gp09 [Geobacillus phage vB_GthS_PK2.1]|nr:hypothetical protein PK21_gp09 [Geobacillus phage vB_GthS_PK2.1]